MILTVTPNTALDFTVLVGDFAWNATIRSMQNTWGMGGKPADASWILGEMGVDTTALGFAAGEIGRKMERLLRSKNVKTDFVWVDGETRLDVHIIEQKDGRQSTITSDSLNVTPLQVTKLKDKFLTYLHNASCLVLGGSLPAGVPNELYPELIEIARGKGIPTIFDSSGEALLAGLTTGPAIIKPNQVELSQLSGKQIHSLQDAYSASQQILNEYGTQVVVTMGKEGALAVLRDCTYFIPPEKDPDMVLSTAGAGDAVLAGIAYAFAQGVSLEEGLKLGFAAARAVIRTLGTADCARNEVEKFIQDIELRQFP